MATIWPAATVAQVHPELSSGPMLAYAEMTEVAIWVQTKKDAQVEVRYGPVGQPLNSHFETKNTSKASDHIALFKLTSLDVGTRYKYELRINGQTVSRDYPLEFQTQPNWRYDKNPPVPPTFKFALGSCSYVNEGRPFDRAGTPYGGDYELFLSIHKDRPDFMVWLGDNFYYREPDWLTESAMRYRQRRDRQLAQLQPLLGSTHHYATWDDHDYGPNDSDRSFRLKEESLRVFSDYWPAVRYGAPGLPGCFQRFVWGDVEFFMLDDRSYRSSTRAEPDMGKEMLGAAQVRWLKDALLNSNSTFKVICNGSQMLNPIVMFEGWGDFPEEQKAFLDWLARNKVPGVMFLSGDRHMTELIKLLWPSAAYAWHDWTSSPLGSGVGRGHQDELNNPARVPGTLVNTARNYGICEVSGPWNDRKLKLITKDKDGKVLWTHEISQKEMRG